MQNRNSLAEGSFVYQDLADIYAEFSWAEDAKGEVYRYLLPRLKDCSVLDVGCGTGKYRKLFSPVVKTYVGLDSSAAMLCYGAKDTAPSGNAPLVHGQAGELPFETGTFDVVLGTWFADIHHAKCIFKAIWGENVSQGIGGASIGHRITIYEFEKVAPLVAGSFDASV